MIRSDSPKEPFQPLLRPLQAAAPPPTLVVPVPRARRVPSSSMTPLTIPSELDGKAPESGDVAPTASRGAEHDPVSAHDLTPPTPSPLFPRDLTVLVRLSQEETMTLMKDYGLEVTGEVDSSSTRGTKRAPNRRNVTQGTDLEETREETLNRFLTFIGVSGKACCAFKDLVN